MGGEQSLICARQSTHRLNSCSYLGGARHRNTQAVLGGHSVPHPRPLFISLTMYVYVPSDSVAQTRLRVTVEWVGLGARFFLPDAHRVGQLTGSSYDRSDQLVSRTAHNGKGELESTLKSCKDLANGSNWGTQPTCLPTKLHCRPCAAEQSALKPDLASNHAIIKTIL